MTITTPAPAADAGIAPFDRRLATARAIFLGALLFNGALTAFWAFLLLTGRQTLFFKNYTLDAAAVGRVLGGVFFFYVLWGFIWYGIKNLLLKTFVGFSREERRAAFSSRMQQPFDVAALTARYSERRIRIVDMIGRRGRFITLAAAAFFYLYLSIQRDPLPSFASAFLQENLADAVLTSWIFLGFFYVNGFLAASFYGPQSRVMDGVLARANCLLITTLWTFFKFVMVPIGGQLARVFSPGQFAVVFALIWGAYIVTDALAEIGGSLFGRQRIRVLGVGDVNRKSIAGVVSGFSGCLVFCLWVVLSNGLGGAWIGLAVALAVSNTLLELFSPRGTDDFTMATAGALICWAFGALVLA